MRQSTPTLVDYSDPHLTDPSILASQSSFHTVKIIGITYKRVRVYYRPHPLAQFPPQNKHDGLPLVVFCHGLGGSLSQFEPLIRQLGFMASYLAIDLPGCGRSDMDPSDWNAYGCQNLVRCIEAVVLHYLNRDRQQDGVQTAKNCQTIIAPDVQLHPVDSQRIVLVGHSMGASHCALLASPFSLISSLVSAVVALCPPDIPSPSLTSFGRIALKFFPETVFNLLRWWDQRGNIESTSVKRFTGPTADERTRLRQYRYNLQSKTPAWKRCGFGALPIYNSSVTVETNEEGSTRKVKVLEAAKGVGIPGQNVWREINCPVLCILGEQDKVVSVNESKRVFEALPDNVTPPCSISEWVSEAKLRYPQNTWIWIDRPRSLNSAPDDNTTDMTCSSAMIIIPQANHTLPYATDTVPLVGSMVRGFLESLNPSLSFSSQASSLTGGSLDWVTDLPKWESSIPVSTLIAGKFRTMKVPRLNHKTHSLESILMDYFTPNDSQEQHLHQNEDNHLLGAIIDLSAFSTYTANMFTLPESRILHIRFLTESGIIPTVDEVDEFCDLVDKVSHRLSIKLDPGDSDDDGDDLGSAPNLLNITPDKPIFVHCDYGINRAGFLIISYMVLRLDWDLAKAINEVDGAREGRNIDTEFIEELRTRYV